MPVARRSARTVQLAEELTVTASLKSCYSSATARTSQHTSADGTVTEARNTRKEISGVPQMKSRWTGLGKYKLV